MRAFRPSYYQGAPPEGLLADAHLRQQQAERDVPFTPMVWIPGGEAGETRVRLNDAAIDVTQIHIDEALTNVSIAYTNGEFIAEQIAPVVPVNLKSNKYYVYGKERFRRKFTLFEPGTAPRETAWSLSNQGYFCEGHASRGWYPWEAPMNADPVLDLDIDTTETQTDQVLLDQEMSLVDTIAANVTATDLSQGGGANQWDNPDNDPILFIDKQKEAVAGKIGRKPNKIAFGRPAFRGIRNNPNLIRRVFGTTAPSDPLVTPQMLAEKLEVDEVLVGEAMYDQVPEGEATSLAYIWGNTTLLFYADPSPGRRKLAFMYHFMWNVGSQGYIVEKFYDQNRKIYVIDVRKYYDQNVVAAGAAVYFTNTLQNP